LLIALTGAALVLLVLWRRTTKSLRITVTG